MIEALILVIVGIALGGGLFFWLLCRSINRDINHRIKNPNYECNKG